MNQIKQGTTESDTGWNEMTSIVEVSFWLFCILFQVAGAH